MDRAQVGQINLNCEFGQKIKNISSKCSNIVEIGTWNGCGSTTCVLNGMNKNTNFISIELIEEMYELAKANLRDKPVKLLHGTVINYEDLKWFNIKEHKKTCSKLELDHFNLYYEKEVTAIKNSKNVLNELPSIIDFLILDGGEYSTYPEWKVLEKRTNIVALDDTKLLKTKKIKEELQSNPDWVTYWESEERNGCSIHFKKIIRNV